MQKELMAGPMRAPMPAGKGKSDAVIAKLPQIVKSVLVLVSFANSIVWIIAVLGWIGWEDGMGEGQKAVSAVLISFCVFIIPFLMIIFTRIDWGQRGGS